MSFRRLVPNNLHNFPRTDIVQDSNSSSAMLTLDDHCASPGRPPRIAKSAGHPWRDRYMNIKSVSINFRTLLIKFSYANPEVRWAPVTSQIRDNRIIFQLTFGRWHRMCVKIEQNKSLWGCHLKKNKKIAFSNTLNLEGLAGCKKEHLQYMPYFNLSLVLTGSSWVWR